MEMFISLLKGTSGSMLGTMLVYMGLFALVHLYIAWLAGYITIVVTKINLQETREFYAKSNSRTKKSSVKKKNRE